MGEFGIRDAMALALPLLIIDPTLVDLAEDIVEAEDLVVERLEVVISDLGRRRCSVGCGDD